MSDSRPCEVCQTPTGRGPLARLCHRCDRIAKRVDPRHTGNTNARIKALKNSWDGHVFRCFYSGVSLVENDSGHPRYITLDHRTPRNEEDIVISASLINDMKTYMNENTFKEIVIALADHFKQGTTLEDEVLDRVPRRKR